ncbi:NAD(P)-binding domain-containing protein [Amycolatopsis sp. OK19-0408]|uniref:NAD(P)-binding domain-containing protein n=1 Tax=Amycolatopsis iheyensis TaxID=2945988 RepID=A0A9X2NA66_9PSEU|nr:NAD(P)-dependent oxidoreductase [Amycolatopsis iheyensis]MCR6484919.1 NAD(P)-binding domain-containing protein [Amycolatopsis iheyensis]
MSATIAVLGLGEAGSALARDLVAAGAVVRGYDPAVPAAEGVVATGSEADAAEGADLVLSVNKAAAAVDALEAGLAGLKPGAAWADLNTASPGTKRELATLAAGHDVPFADIAIMAPVPGRGLRVPMLATGVAAESVATTLNSLGAAVETMAGDAGLAAERKLLRSVFFKGMSAAVVEALQAARAAGCEDWLRKIIVDELTAANAATVDRLVDGSYTHAVRRTAEMAAAAEMLGELGVRADVAGASRDQLAHLADSQDCKQS